MINDIYKLTLSTNGSKYHDILFNRYAITNKDISNWIKYMIIFSYCIIFILDVINNNKTNFIIIYSSSIHNSLTDVYLIVRARFMSEHLTVRGTYSFIMDLGIICFIVAKSSGNPIISNIQ